MKELSNFNKKSPGTKILFSKKKDAGWPRKCIPGLFLTRRKVKLATFRKIGRPLYNEVSGGRVTRKEERKKKGPLFAPAGVPETRARPPAHFISLTSKKLWPGKKFREPEGRLKKSGFHLLPPVSYRKRNLTRMNKKTRNAEETESPTSLTNTVSLLTILQNKLMAAGRKGAAERVFFKTVAELNRQSPNSPGVLLFYQALDRAKPTLGTVLRRVGRNYYHVPVPLSPAQKYKLAFQWLLEAARKSPRTSLPRRLAEEIKVTSSSPYSEALKKKEALHQLIVKNRAYSHYRWI